MGTSGFNDRDNGSLCKEVVAELRELVLDVVAPFLPDKHIAFSQHSSLSNEERERQPTKPDGMDKLDRRYGPQAFEILRRPSSTSDKVPALTSAEREKDSSFIIDEITIPASVSIGSSANSSAKSQPHIPCHTESNFQSAPRDIFIRPSHATEKRQRCSSIEPTRLFDNSEGTTTFASASEQALIIRVLDALSDILFGQEDKDGTEDDDTSCDDSTDVETQEAIPLVTTILVAVFVILRLIMLAILSR